MNAYIKEFRVEEVHCRELDDKRIYYDCEYCESYHTHGNAGELSDYIHNRGCHCKHPAAPTDVKIIVDYKTVRTLEEKN